MNGPLMRLDPTHSKRKKRQGKKGPSVPFPEKLKKPRHSPIEVIHPSEWRVPFIFASPHSGRRYPTSFLEMSDLDLMTLRRSEDSYVDLLVDQVTDFGAPLLKALFPRVYIDVNRHTSELDPYMFEGPGITKEGLIKENQALCEGARTSLVLAGFGVLPRLAADGMAIYGQKLPFSEAEYRLKHYYTPYHDALEKLVEACLSKFGYAIIIDCHSMPSQDSRGRPIRNVSGTDFVLGDRYGAASSPAIMGMLEGLLIDQNYYVRRNAPYAGGFVTSHYGKPAENIHAVQLEINRRLYLDEKRVARHGGFNILRSGLMAVFEDLVSMNPEMLAIRAAAE